MAQGTSTKTQSLEIAYKTPILRGFLIFLIPLTFYLGVRDIIYESPWAVFFFLLQASFLGAAWGFHLRGNYKGASHLIVFGVSLAQMWDIALLGYHDIHSFYMVSVVCSLLLLGGSFLLSSLGPIVFHSASLWGYYIVFAALNREFGAAQSGRLALEAQLAVPTMGFAVSTLLALGSRRIFDQIIKSQKTLLKEANDHQQNLGLLIRGIAHRLNTPLGNAKMILSTDLPVDGEHRAVLTGAIHESTNLITRLKSFLTCSESRILSHGSFAEHLMVLQKHHLPESILTAGPEVRKSMNEVRTHYWEAVHLVLNEIFDNAALHGDRNRPCELVLKETAAGEISLEVRNSVLKGNSSGVGKCIQPFFTTLNQASHPGLGLYFADHLVKRKLGGRLTVEEPEPFQFKVAITFPGRIDEKKADLDRSAS